eukprot:5629640-Pyramimonas_sp.AAC.1
MGRIERLDESITLNTAGGSSRALGSDQFASHARTTGIEVFDAQVMPETPAVISVGERCMDHGFISFGQQVNDPTYFCPAVTE